MDNAVHNNKRGLANSRPYLADHEARDYLNSLMLRVRHLVVDLQEEQHELKGKLRDVLPANPQTVTTIASPTETSTTTTRTQATLLIHSETTSANSTTNTRSSISSSNLNANTLTASPLDEPTTSATTTTTTTNKTISSGTLSQAATTNSTDSTRPPPYKSIIKPTTLARTSEVPKPPVRTRRRNTLTAVSGDYSRFTMSAATNGVSRGALIILEGLDRVGKSTLAQKLVEHLERIKRPVTSCRFPDRTTPVGQLINDFLKSSSKKVDDHTMHLLFSANRWELSKKIRNTLKQGTTVIVDRYAYSGIAYSSAKRDVTMDWCCETEKGLPRPDLVIYLELAKEAQYKRPGFGDERFETSELQELVRHKYEHLMEISLEDWLRIDVENKSPEQVLAEVILPVKRCLDSCGNKDIEKLDFACQN